MTTETILADRQLGEEWDKTTGVYEYARAIEQAVLQSPEVQALREDAERMRNALNKIAAMDIMSYHSLESAKIVAIGAMGKSI